MLHKLCSVQVGPKTTENNIQCLVNHTSLFSGLIYTLPDVVNPIEEFSHSGAIENNMVCLLVVATVFLVYTILLIWSKYQDNKDILRVKYKVVRRRPYGLFKIVTLQGEIIILQDNYPGEDEVYLVTVYTGHYSAAGTTANVCIQLHGDVSSSRVNLNLVVSTTTFIIHF